MKTAIYLTSMLNTAFAIATGSRLCLAFAAVTGLVALAVESAGLVRVVRRTM